MDDAISEMEDANQLETQLNKQIGNISQNLHISLRQHSKCTHEDVAMAMLENARLTVGFHKHILRELEAVRSDLVKVGSDKGTDVLTAVGNVNGEGKGKINNSQVSTEPLTSSSSQPQMTGSRPYDSSPNTRSTINTSQSMFLPPPASRQPQIPNSASGNVRATGTPSTSAGVNPLGGQMAQSMVLPPGHRPQTMGRQQGRKLDERQAAKLLAGGF